MLRRLAIASALVVASTSALRAQAWVYPSLQPTRVAVREYTFALADGDGGGTGLVFQWREGLSGARTQFTMDAGFADPGNGADTRLLIGGGLAYQLTTAKSDMPFDIVVAGGLGLTTGDARTTIRVPFGAAVGHTFPLEGGLSIAPFVHPRLTWDRSSSNGTSNSDTNLSIDVGATFAFKPQMAVRVAAALGDDDAVAIAFAWTPKGLR